MDNQEMARTFGGGLLSFPVTHFTGEGKLNEASYRDHLSWLLEFKPAGLFAAGGTGEYFSLTLEEFASTVLVGSVGGILGGVSSDKLLLAGRSLTFSRKAPIVLGMVLATAMMLCNVVDTQWGILLLMSVAFFGKGFGALGWTVIADVSPRDMVGLNGGMFNLCGNIAGITTPIVIGYLVQRTGSFRYALIYVGVTALLAVASYLFVTGPIRRLTVDELGIASVAA